MHIILNWANMHINFWIVNGSLFGTTLVSCYQKNIHPLQMLLQTTPKNLQNNCFIHLLCRTRYSIVVLF